MLMPLTETRRRAYLNALGVECLAPRFILPAAKSSALLEVDVPQLIDVPQPIDVLPSGVVQQAETVQTPIVRAATIAQHVIEKKSVEQTATISQQASTRLQLCLISTDAAILIVDSLSSDRPQFSSAHERLLRSISVAMGWPLTELTPTPFIWPPVKQRHFDASLQAAQEMLIAAINGQLQRTGAQTLLLLGKSAAQTALQGEWELLRNTPQSWKNSSVNVVVAESLQEMLENPITKRQCWLSLLAANIQGPRSGG